MENQNKNESFTYTYSARQQEEIKRIRQKYLPPEEDKMEQLRRLDRSAAQKGNIAALVTGVIGMLFFGFGMCCVLVWTGMLLIPGILAGIFGIVLMALANPVYHCITKKERERIAPEILRLTDELMK
ncbi:MAG: hypothetical protein IJX93_01245 [Clostridia bacterium]|nr:hypothetical protein [Clostridia bacterium]